MSFSEGQSHQCRTTHNPDARSNTPLRTHYNLFKMNLPETVLSAKSKPLVLYYPLSAKVREIVNGLTVARG